MIDLFEDDVGYTEICLNLKELRNEVSNLDDDSLVDELSSIVHILDDEVQEKVQHIMFKNNADVDLTEEEVQFLNDVYVVYYAGFAYFVDDEEVDDEIL
jgi:hypothetical protein